MERLQSWFWYVGIALMLRSLPPGIFGAPHSEAPSYSEFKTLLKAVN